MTFTEFASLAQSRGLVAECKNFGSHWRITGGVVAVNFYPDKNTVYIDGARCGIRRCDPKAAIEAAFKPQVGLVKTRRRYAERLTPKARRRERLRMLRSNPQCHWCHKTVDAHSSTIDHVIPLSRGGLDHPNNMVLACRACNMSRGNSL